jgi:hypothetical protein
MLGVNTTEAQKRKTSIGATLNINTTSFLVDHLLHSFFDLTGSETRMFELNYGSFLFSQNILTCISELLAIARNGDLPMTENNYYLKTLNHNTQNENVL